MVLKALSKARRSAALTRSMSSLALTVCPFIVFVAASTHAQTQPAGRAFPEATWPVIFTAEFGIQQSLGYQPLHSAAGIGLEKPIGKWMELDPSVSWSPDDTLLTHNGNSLSFQADGIMWSGLGRLFGIAGGFDYMHVWTSRFSHGALSPSLGMAVRLHPWRIPGRLYLTYVVPYGGYDARTGLENSRSQGPEVYFEGQIATRFRLGLKLTAYHFLGEVNNLVSGQGNNTACAVSSPCYGPPGCSTSGTVHWGGAAVLVIRLTPRQSTARLY